VKVAPIPAPAPPADTPAAPRAPLPAPVKSAPEPQRVALPAKQAAAASAAPVPEVPTSLELRNKRVAVYMRQSQQQQAAGDYAGLARTCQRWADDDWRNPRAFYCAGIGLQGIGRHKDAIIMFNQAGALLPKDDPLKSLIADAVLRSFRAESGG